MSEEEFEEAEEDSDDYQSVACQSPAWGPGPIQAINLPQGRKLGGARFPEPAPHPDGRGRGSVQLGTFDDVPDDDGERKPNPTGIAAAIEKCLPAAVQVVARAQTLWTSAGPTRA